MQTEFKKWELVEVSDDGVDWKAVRFNWLEEEKTSQYAVFVVGKQSPSKLNHTLESAIKEAERLCSKENKKAYIVRLVWVQSPKVVSEFTSL